MPLNNFVRVAVIGLLLIMSITAFPSIYIDGDDDLDVRYFKGQEVLFIDTGMNLDKDVLVIVGGAQSNKIIGPVPMDDGIVIVRLGILDYGEYTIQIVSYEDNRVIFESSIHIQSYISISFNLGQGQNIINPITASVGEDYVLPRIESVVEGVVFKGWMIDGTIFEAGDIIRPVKDTEVTAVWQTNDNNEANDYKDQYDVIITIIGMVLTIAIIAVSIKSIKRS